MFNKLSLKIGLLFFTSIVIIGSLLFFILYTNLVNDRVEEVMDNLLARAKMHSAVLEDHFDSSTLEHVGLMESASEFAVIITDKKGNILINSDPVEEEMKEIIQHINYENIPNNGEIVENHWKEKRYIVADNPIIINGEHQGHVLMFAPTSIVENIVDRLGEQFIVVGLITIFLTIITIFILSRFVTLPMIKIKEATELMSKGVNNVVLNTGRKDELGVLSNSIARLSKDLEQIKKDRNEFLASISHELRTPLTYIKGYADVISRHDTSPEEREEFIRIIQEETEHLNVLIKNLFELAKMDENNFVIRPKEILLEALILPLTDRMRPAFIEKNITFTVSCPIGTIAYVDSERIKQVLLNLLDNAKKHTCEGGYVSLEVHKTDHEIRMTVTDNGEGIPKEDLPKIFDRLYRVEKSRSRRNGGSGLGLAIVKEIIEAHGGRVDVQSKLGKGTCITISLRRWNQDE